ncbi:uncharacterized protein [Salvelinus alpinus]|uniref:uncharacterized protein n=1 Tax=Salvelinus alpinus TaxID=8036 RepID=UPI0039FBCEB1
MARSIQNSVVCVEVDQRLTSSKSDITDVYREESNTDSVLKKAQQRLFNLRRQKKFGLSPKALTNFYRCTIESILSGCITAWYGNCSAHNRKALQRVVRSAQRISGGKLPALQDTYTTRCHRKAIKIIKDNNHPSHCLFTPLSSRRRVCGAKNVGKSTFNRHLISTLLNHTASVEYLECDLGQTEFTPSGCFSLSTVREPLLGPPLHTPVGPRAHNLLRRWHRRTWLMFYILPTNCAILFF